MRLIDADKLIEKINNFHIADARCVTVMNGVANLIKEQPTAYDLDKVVEELEKQAENTVLDFMSGGYVAIDKAIEIVKQGGATKNCNNCANYTESDEVDNGCYLCCKGYEDNYEPKVDNDGVGKDVDQMKATGIVKRFDDLGRIVIPKEIRRQIFGTKCTDGEPMEIFMDKDEIILRKYEGNVDDNVCEWTLTDTRKVMPYKTSCGNEDLYDNSWKYCPHCSKKIKVVE